MSKHFICLVTDSKGEQDILDVISLDDIDCIRWVDCKVLREIVE